MTKKDGDMTVTLFSFAYKNFKRNWTQIPIMGLDMKILCGTTVNHLPEIMRLAYFVGL